jgi:uncharacterized protein YuzE
MKIIYDEEVDILYIRLREGEYEESDEVSKGVIVDYDKDGKPIAVEILRAKLLLGPMDSWAVEYARVRGHHGA